MGSLHARVLRQSLHTDLVYVVEPDADRGSAVADQWGAKWVPALDDFDDVDAVVVASPTGTHLEWALRAIEAGRSHPAVDAARCASVGHVSPSCFARSPGKRTAGLASSKISPLQRVA